MVITVRDAVVDDLRWIEPLLKKGSTDGHFAPTVGKQGGMLVLAALHGSEINMARLRNGTMSMAKVRATVHVAELDTAPSSFLLALHDETGLEVHLAATKREALRNGLFNALVSNAISNATSTGRVYARCYQKSTWAIRGLEKLGFVVSGGTNPVELDYQP